METVAYIGLGSNLGDREGAIAEALRLIAGADGVRLGMLSSPWETDARIVLEQPIFINAAAQVHCRCTARQMLDTLLAAESTLGRERHLYPKGGPRKIDVDLLLFGGSSLDQDRLTVPHPEMLSRGFVLGPLAEIAGDVVHPRTGKTIARHFVELPNDEQRAVRKLPRAFAIGRPQGARL